jgi:AraC-like DNA-binding protein
MPHSPFYPSPHHAPSDREPVTVHLRRPPADAVIEWHNHDWAQLAFPVSGGIRVAATGMGWIVPVFRAIWIPPHTRHEVIMLGQVSFYVAYVNPASAPLPLAACGVVEVSNLMREIIFHLADAPEMSIRRRELMTDLLLLEIGQAKPLSLGLPMPSDRRLKHLCDALMEDPAATLSLSEWAPKVGASERTLARLFKNELRTSFADWRQQLRLARAVDLMGRGVALATVAEEVGYANPAAFSSMFKRVLGVPPSQFAQQRPHVVTVASAEKR